MATQATMSKSSNRNLMLLSLLEMWKNKFEAGLVKTATALENNSRNM